MRAPRTVIVLARKIFWMDVVVVLGGAVLVVGTLYV